MRDCVLFSIAVSLTGILAQMIVGVPITTEIPRELRCYQGCVETYRADTTADAGMRLADCTDRCAGE